MYLIFDVSGITKPKDWKAPFSDTFSWPRILHMSWIMLNEELKPIKDFDCIIKRVNKQFPIKKLFLIKIIICQYIGWLLLVGSPV